MNKRRIVTVATLVLVLALSVAMLAACGGSVDDVVIPQAGGEELPYFPANFTAVDYSEMEEQADIDAFDFVCEVYDNWVADKGYKRTQYFSFEAKAPAKTITSFSNDVYKIDGDKLYRRLIVVQDSKPFQDNKNDITRFYFDGTAAKRAFLRDKKFVPGAKDDIFAFVGDEPAMTPFTGDEESGTVEEMMKTYTSHMTTYVWRDKANLIMDDMKVYKASDGTLRFTMTINCSKEMMDSAHTAARDEFLASTGADEGTLEMQANTTIDFVVKDFDGTKKIVAWRRTEQYKGKAMGLVGIPAKQTSVETFEYDEAAYKITDEDIA